MDWLNFIARIHDLVSDLIAAVALAVSLVALARAVRASRRAGRDEASQKILHLRERLLSPELRAARRVIVFSPPIIRAAGDDYATYSHSRAYLSDAGALAAAARGGAQDADTFTDAYSRIFSAIAEMAAALPAPRDLALRRLWRKQTSDLYGHMSEMLRCLDEARWELSKHLLLWPLDRETLGETPTLLSDESVTRQLEKLNAGKHKHAPELKLGASAPTAP